MDAAGFSGSYDFFFMPRGPCSKQNHGHAFGSALSLSLSAEEQGQLGAFGGIQGHVGACGDMWVCVWGECGVMWGYVRVQRCI